MSAIPYCEQYGTRLVTQYEALSFEDVHADLIAILPAPGGTVLDIGSGSGRDCGVARGKRIRRRGRRAVRGHARPRARETRVEPICSSETLIGPRFSQISTEDSMQASHISTAPPLVARTDL